MKIYNSYNYQTGYNQFGYNYHVRNNYQTGYANYAYTPPGSVVNSLAQRYHVYYYDAAIAGLPNDTFRRSYTYTSYRYTQPVDQWKLFAKDLNSIVSGASSIISAVSIFYPPAAAVSAVMSPISSGLSVATAQIDTTPKPYTITTTTKYNPWFR